MFRKKISFSAMRCVIVLTGLQVMGSKRSSLRDFEGASINIFGPCLNPTQYYPIYDNDIRKIFLRLEPCSWRKDSPFVMRSACSRLVHPMPVQVKCKYRLDAHRQVDTMVFRIILDKCI